MCYNKDIDELNYTVAKCYLRSKEEITLNLNLMYCIASFVKVCKNSALIFKGNKTHTPQNPVLSTSLQNDNKVIQSFIYYLITTSSKN